MEKLIKWYVKFKTVKINAKIDLNVYQQNVSKSSFLIVKLNKIITTFIIVRQTFFLLCNKKKYIISKK